MCEPGRPRRSAKALYFTILTEITQKMSQYGGIIENHHVSYVSYGWKNHGSIMEHGKEWKRVEAI